MSDIRKEIEYYNNLRCEFIDFVNLPKLEDKDISLVCYMKSPSIPEKKFVPAYLFYICKDGETIGEINLRIGYNDGLYYGGQVGYCIYEKYRGNGYAVKACKLIAQVAKSHKMDKLLITNEHNNLSSKRVCEKIGAKLLRTAKLPEWHGMYKEGKRYVNIYEWDLYKY